MMMVAQLLCSVIGLILLSQRTFAFATPSKRQFSNPVSHSSAFLSEHNSAVNLRVRLSLADFPVSFPQQRKVFGGYGAGLLLRGGSEAAIGSSRRLKILVWVLTFLLVRERWYKIPHWLQRIITSPWRKLIAPPLRFVKGLTGFNVPVSIDDDDSSNSIVSKLQNIMSMTSSVGNSVEFQGLELQFALFVMLNAVERSKKSTAMLWDNFYAESGKPLFDSTSAVSKNETIHNMIDQLHLSDWAYLEETDDIHEKLTEQSVSRGSTDYNWNLLRHVKTNRPGRVGHYIAIDAPKKLVLISVKGTSDLSDMVTDACGVPVRYDIEEADGNSTKIACHEGVLDASIDLADSLEPLLKKLFLPAGYRILLVGHSLGAGVACMVGSLLRARIPKLTERINGTLQLEVVAFAPPPILNYEAALSASSFATSIVNHDDLVPRSSLINLVSLRKFLGFVKERLEELDINPDSPSKAVLLLKKAIKGNEDSIMSGQEIFDGLNEVRNESIEEAGIVSGNRTLEEMDDLFIPGKVFILYEKHSLSGDGTESLETVDADAVVTDGQAPVLRHINLNKRMLSDHMPDAYEKTLRTLL